ncbi:MAG: amidohydrolase family protein, partial [Gemmatimonadales bacterium]
MTALLLVFLVGAQQAPDTVRYSVIIGGTRAGQEIAIHEPGGALRFSQEYNDRGRGPAIATRITLGPGGLFASIETSGHDYWKKPVDERFTMRGDTAVWRSDAEQGSRRLARPALYVPMNAPVSSFPLIVHGLEAAGGRLALLPAGEARAEKAGERTVTAGGRTARITHYQVIGFDFTPTDLWLREDGRLFAFVAGSWFRVIRDGWESVGDALAAAQDSVRIRREETLAGSLADRSASTIVIRNAAIFDAPHALLLRGQTVVVRDGRIQSVGPGTGGPVPRNARVIDARGKTLLPGLWDMHAHVSPTDGLLDIAAGVTSVRDLANDIDELAQLRRRWDDGSAIGPRVAVMAGFIDGPGPYAGPTEVLVSTADSARAWVDRYADLGYEQIKLYSSLDTALVAVVAERARARGLRLSGHIPLHMTAAQAVRAGYDEIQHVNMLFLNFLGDTIDSRTPERFTAVGRYGPDLDLASDSVRAFIRLLEQRGTVVDPTLATFEGMFTALPGVMDRGAAKIAPRLPAQIRRGFLTGGLATDDAQAARYDAAFAKMLAFVKALYDAGVPIVAGTDCLAGMCLHRELELYSQAGIPNAAVLRLATWGA